MKRIFTITMMLLVTGLANAQQQIINGGFEYWDTLGDYTQPTNWYSINPLVAFGFEPSTTITADAHSGNFAVQLESLSNPFSDISGVLCSGPVLSPSLEPDFTQMKVGFTDVPEKLEFYYKSFPMEGDTSVLSMCMTRWNANTQSADTIAVATKMFYDSIGVYTLASLEFDYFSSLQPDSMFIIASSSVDGFNPTVGSRLILDDLVLIYEPTGIEKIQPVINALIYPNPAQDQLTVKMQQPQVGTVYLYDLLGNLVHRQIVDGNEVSVTTSNMKDGLYILMVQAANGAKQTYKVIIQN